jgi:hypothetical protein
MNKKVKVTMTLPPAEYAVGDQVAESDSLSFSGWVAAKIRSEARQKFNIDLDNVSEADREKILSWIDAQNGKKRKKGRRKSRKKVVSKG